MAYQVEYRPEVYGDLEDVPRNMIERIERAVAQRLATQPSVYGERLRRSLTGTWRIRVGDYRIAYTIDEAAQRVTIWAIRHRKEIDPLLQSRWRRA